MNVQPQRWLPQAALAVIAVGVLVGWGWRAARPVAAVAGTVSWAHLSTISGDIPSPNASKQQTALVVDDFNNDGLNDFVVATRRDPGPSLMWYQRHTGGWTRHVIDSTLLRIEAGGTSFDVDNDGDKDIVMGGDGSSNQIWWWENPLPQGDPTAHWTRRLIKNSGPRRHHDLVFADVDGDGTAELAFWNQKAQSLYMAEIPADPRQTSPWLNIDTGENVVLVAQSPTQYYEGLATADIDLDGQTDLVSGGYWYKHNPDGTFTTYEVAPSENLRVAVGQLVPGGRPEIVLTPGDAVGMARWYQWDGASWIGHDLHEVKFAHSLEVGDVDGDGNLDVFIGEMKFAPSDINHNPGALTWLHYGDGLGNFTTTIVATGAGQHESRLADLNGDGDLDILGKPFTADTPRLDIWLNSDVAPNPVCEPLDDWDRLVVGDSGTHRNVLVATPDLDGDGRLDIVAGKYWYRNPGPGLSWEQNLVGGLFNQFATSGDFDSDGDIDLLGTVSNDPAADRTERGNAFVWARNDGTGTFSTLDNIQPGTGNFLQGVALGTFVPGATDIVLSWHANTTGLEVLRLPPDPAGELWALSPLSTSAHQNEDLSQGDIDGDGDPDLLLGTQWLRNQGAGQWADNSLITATRSPDRNELADINGDGRLDAVVGYEALNEAAVLAWYRAPADPALPWPEVVIANIFGPMSVGAADMDGDGDADVVVGEHSTQDTTARRVLVYENTNGLGTSWQQHLVYTGDEHHDGALPVDIDGDGDLDIVSIGWTHGRVHLYQNGACAAAEPTATPTPTPTNTADVTPTPTFTATTTPEITDTPTPAPTNTAAGTETPSATSTDTPAATATPTMTPTATRSATCPAPRSLDRWDRHVIDANRPGQATYLFDVDVNGDGRTDLVTGQFWYENTDGNAGGAWTRHLIGAPLSDVIAAHDFDGDGDLDFLGTAGNTIYPNGVWAPFAWARNDGNGVLTVLSNIDGDMIMPVNDPVQGVAIAQFTPGGPTEIAITWDDTENPNRNANGIQVLTVPANPSADTWARRTLSDFSLGEDLNAADLDEDGDLDLFLGKSWLRNNHPSAGWTPIEIFSLPAGYQASRQSLLDVDKDNDLDAIIGYSHSPEKQQVAWYEQQGSPFSPWIEHVILELTSSAPNGYAESLDVADMDGDGDSDVLVGEYRVNYNPPGSYPGKLWIVENIGDGDAWQPHLVYDGDSHYQSSQAADIDRDGDLDIISKGWLHNRVHVYENGACDAAPAEGTPTPTATSSATPSSTPTASPTVTASHTPTATQTVSPSPTPATTPTVSPSPTPSAAGFGKLLISTSSNGAVDGIAYADEDILAFDMASNSWSLWFDGSDVGLGGVDLNALAELEDGRLLLSFEGPVSLPGLGKIDDSDIVLFTPESLGPDTAGTLAVYLVGSDYALTRRSEGIDALTLTGDGGLLVSTKGSMRSGALRAQGQDLVRVQLSAAGWPTNDWTASFIGAAAGLSTDRENIGAVWQEASMLYLVTYGSFAAGGLKGSSGDIFRCQMPTTGPANDCSFDPGLFWQGSLHGLGTNRIDALSLQR